MILNGWHSDRTQERFFHLAIPFVLMAAAFAVLAASPSPPVAMIAYLAAVACNTAIGGVFWLVPSDLLHPRSTAVSVAAINAIGQSGSFVCPYAWGLAKDHTGGFHAGLAALPVGFLLAAAIVLLVRHQTRSVRRAARLAQLAAS